MMMHHRRGFCGMTQERGRSCSRHLLLRSKLEKSDAKGSEGCERHLAPLIARCLSIISHD